GNLNQNFLIVLRLRAMRRDGLVRFRGRYSYEEICFVIAVTAAACSGVAFAGEVKQDKAQVVKATTMSDAQMDKVTAGDPGNGHAWGTKVDGPAWNAPGFVGKAPDANGHTKP